MENSLVIGSDIRYAYGENDRLAIPWASESMTFRARITEPGRFGESFLTVKRFSVDFSKREAAQLTNPDVLKRWEDLTKLYHENVVAYHQIAMKFEHPGAQSGRIKLEFAMDYSDGSDLRNMLNQMAGANRTLHVKTLFDFSKQIANGLSYLHKNNIAHGGLKLSNILVDKSSENNLRLRLCGLDNFLPSYTKFIQQWYANEIWMAPEQLMIIKDAASFLQDDPYFSALHMKQKQIATKFDMDTYGKELIAVTEKLVCLYGYCGQMHREGMVQEPQDRFRRFLDDGFGSRGINFALDAGHVEVFRHSYDILLQFWYISGMDIAKAQELCALLFTQDNEAEYVEKLLKTPAEILDNFMSEYFQQKAVSCTTESVMDARGSGYHQSCLVSVPSQSVRFDGRKADIWSLGKIMEFLAAHTFDASRKMAITGEIEGLGQLMQDLADHSFDKFRTMAKFQSRRWTVRMKKMGLNTRSLFESYSSNFIPRDFCQIFAHCLRRSTGGRPTAEEVVNKLVALETDTYGSTWIDNFQHGGVEEDTSACHRQMLEEIGHKCRYEYSFWKDFVGQGAHGNVYKATITELFNYKGSGTVAVKVLTLRNTKIKQIRQDGRWVKAREQWGKLLSLKHPHLVTYHKVTVWKLLKGAEIEFMMDYCEGGDLDSLITQCQTGVCSLSVEAVLNYAMQLATGIYYLHENEFVHGDLKPGNVFMSRATGDTGNRMLRIGDLDGAVRIRGDCSQPERKDIAGTGPYMSPEMVMQLFGNEHEDIGFPTDLWSLGCVVLDLANCCAGIKKRLFWKTVANSEGVLETREIERQDFSADAFLFNLSLGYHPFVSQLIDRNIRDIIQLCLVQACKDRATASLVLEQLSYDGNPNIDDISQGYMPSAQDDGSDENQICTPCDPAKLLEDLFNGCWLMAISEGRSSANLPKS